MQQYLTRAEAAEACGCHPDSLRRDEKVKGLVAHKRDDGVVRYAVADLVAIGRLVPTALAVDTTDIIQERRALRERDEARRALAAAEERLADAGARLAAQADEIGFLRSTVTELNVRDAVMRTLAALGLPGCSRICTRSCAGRSHGWLHFACNRAVENWRGCLWGDRQA